MGTVQSTTLNTDTDAKRTSSEYGDRGDGTSKWFQWRRTADGGDATAGAKADVAVTDPASSGSLIALLKGLLSFSRVSPTGILKAEDAPHVSGDSGVQMLAVRNDAGTTFGADGDYTPTAAGAGGNAFVSLVPTPATGWVAATSRSTALEASRIVKASAGKAFRISALNTNAAARWLHLFNSATLPADTTVPAMSIPMAAGAFVIVDLGQFGEYLSAGIVVCNSTTAAAKTIGAADTLFQVAYI